MPSSLSSLALNIAPSPTLAIDSKAKSLLSQGADICSFAVGEPDFPTPDFITQACIQALLQGHTKYINSSGLPELRKAIAQHYISHNNFPSISDSNVIVSPGAKFSCYLALLATCNPGDEVLIPAPYWVSYPEMVKLTGATPVFLHTSQSSNFKISPQQLLNSISPKTKLLILNYPSNPTGATYSKQELLQLLLIALQKNIWILADEIYEYLTYDNLSHTSIASLHPDALSNTITISGFSKTFSMTGWRLGTTVAPLPLAKAISDLQSQTTSNATTFAQYAALATFQNPSLSSSSILSFKSTFEKRRNLALSLLNNIPGLSTFHSQGAFYLFPSIQSFGLPSADFASKLLDSHQVAVVPGSAFGAENHIRISYATSEATLLKGLQRLSTFCSSLS